MKASSLALCAASLLAGVAARAQTPYVETTTLTFFWGFTSSYQSFTGNTVPAMPDVATLDPETLPVGYKIYTDTLKPRAYTGPVSNHFPPSGSNADFIKMLLQRAVRDGQLIKEVIGADYRWELVAVREAPKNVKELATNPYRVFLCGQFKNSSTSSPIVEVSSFGSEVVANDPLPPTLLDSDQSTPEVTLDTGLTITLGQFSGNYTESKWEGDRVRTASGSVATAFTVNFGALYYEDPLHDQKDPTPNEEEPDKEFNYHLKRNYWRASASGLINYSIRSTPAPLPTFIASAASATANGWFIHDRNETVYDDGVPLSSDDILKSYGPYSGIAPLRLSMSTIQYQKRDRFPALRPPTAPLVLSATANSATTISLSWYDSSITEESFMIERRTGTSGAWAVIDTIPGDTGTARGYEDYDDTTVSAESTYFYRVRAFNAANGYSSYTDQVKVITPAADPAP